MAVSFKSHLRHERTNRVFWRMARVLPGTLCLILLLAGCPSTKAPEQTTEGLLRGQELELIAPKSLNLPVVWEVLRQEWSSQTGASMKFVEYESETEIPALAESNTPSGGRLVLFPFAKLCQMDPYLTPLPISDAGIDSRDLFKGLRERVVSRERQIVAFPISVPVLACYYRSDLLRAAQRKAPETWDEYQELIDSLKDWAPGLVAVEPLSPEFRATTFFARSLAFCKHPENYSVWFDLDSGKPVINSPGFLEGLETARRCWAKLPSEVMSYSPDDCRRQILAGKAAIGLAWEPVSSQIQSQASTSGESASQRIEGIEIGVCRLPGSRRVFNRNSKKWDSVAAGTIHAPALCGVTGLAAGIMGAGSKIEETAAANLLTSLGATSMFDQAFAVLPKGPCRESQVSFAPGWFGPELSTEEASQYTDAIAQSLRDMQLVSELPLVGADEFRRAASTALDPLLRGEADPEMTLNTMQQAFEVIVQRLGADTVSTSYRRGLGMSPAARK
jgi:multiple sugar transport system substrate-binding protein